MVNAHSPIAECKKAMDIISPSKLDCMASFTSIGRIPVSPTSAIDVEKVSHRRESPKRRVHFFPTVTVKEIPHLDDYSEEMFEAIYLMPKDFAEIKSQVKMTLRLMMSDVQTNNQDFCPRGLEVKTKEGHKRRTLNKQRVRKAVLREQESQRESGLESASFIAEVSMVNSRKSMLAARETALRDEEFALQYRNGMA